MTEVDRFLAICGPPFFPHELVREHQEDRRLLDNLIVGSNMSVCSEADHEFTQLAMTGMNFAKDYCQKLQVKHSFAEISIVDADSAAVPVTRGKRGLCYDVNKVTDMKLRNRLLKNRKSADQSRKRKLEATKRCKLLLMEQDAENKRLKDINTALLHRIAVIESALSRHTGTVVR